MSQGSDGFVQVTAQPSRTDGFVQVSNAPVATQTDQRQASDGMVKIIAPNEPVAQDGSVVVQKDASQSATVEDGSIEAQANLSNPAIAPAPVLQNSPPPDGFRAPVLVYSATTPAILNNGKSSTEVFYFTNSNTDYLNSGRNALSVNDMITNAPDHYRDFFSRNLSQAEELYEATNSLKSLSRQVWSPSNMTDQQGYILGSQGMNGQSESAQAGFVNVGRDWNNEARRGMIDVVRSEASIYDAQGRKYDVPMEYASDQWNPIDTAAEIYGSYRLAKGGVNLFKRSWNSMMERDALMGEDAAEIGETDALMEGVETGEIAMEGAEGAEVALDAATLVEMGVVAAPELMAGLAVAGVGAAVAGLGLGAYEVGRALGAWDSPALDRAAGGIKNAVSGFAHLF